MSNKKIILISLLCLTIFSNGFAKKRPLKLTLTPAQATYYEDHKWDFLEQIFINEISRFTSNCNRYQKISFVTPFLITAFLVVKFEKELRVAKGFHKEEFCLNMCLAELATSFVSLFSWLLTKHLLSHRKQRDQLITALECFLQNYNPDLEKNLDINYKKLIPEEYHKTFDLIKKKYLESKSGRKYLQQHTLDIIYQIRNHIMYDVKKEQYRRPDVVYIHTSHP